MRRLVVILLLLFISSTSVAQADWRWADPVFAKKKVTYLCDTLQCIKQTYKKEKTKYQKKVARYHKRKRKEWNKWTNYYIPFCTWYGESGVGPEYAPYRYTLPNSGGSGAFGKFQFMPGTYHNRAKYHDWSPLDQEIAARREFWANGTAPWANC